MLNQNFLLFLGISIGGLLIEVIGLKLLSNVKKKKKKTSNEFSIGKYLLLILPLCIAAIILTKIIGMSFLYTFLLFCFLGTCGEWLSGFIYHKMMGQRLWTYHRYAIGGYTSLLSMPLWGLAGICFWLLAHSA